MSDPTQPFYYHIHTYHNEDAIDLCVQVTLRRVTSNRQSFTINDSHLTSSYDNENEDFQTKTFKEDKNKKYSSTDTIQKEIKWQEKLFGPQDLVGQYNLYQSEEGKNEDPAMDLSRNLVHSKKDKLNLLKADMIYTRVDDSSYTREHALTNSEIPNRTFLQSHFNPQMGFKMSSTARMMERKKRERPCKTFFIMAALDCNIKRLKRDMKKNTFRIKNKEEYYHDHLLCKIVIDNSGLMEVTPGFSEEEPEDSEGNTIFKTKQGLNIREIRGVRLTTFHFTTPSGVSYEYSLERVTGKGEENKFTYPAANTHSLETERLRYLRKQAVMSLACKKTNIEPTIHIFIDLVSAFHFENCASQNIFWRSGLLCVEYEVILPNGWSCESKGVLDENHSSPLKGCTQLICPYNSNKVAKCLFLPFSNGQTICFQPTNTILGIGLLSLLYFINQLIDAMLTGIYIIVPLMLISLSVSGNYSSPDKGTEYEINHPIVLHLLPPRLKATGNIQVMNKWDQKPVILFQIYSSKNKNVSSVEGCAIYQMPLSRSVQNQIDVLKTWKPQIKEEGLFVFNGEIRGKMIDFYFGTRSQSEHKKKVLLGYLDKNHIPNRLKGITESHGSLELALTVMKNFDDDKQTIPFDSSGINSDEKNSVSQTESVDQVLMRIRKHKRERRLKDLLNKGDDSISNLERYLESYPDEGAVVGSNRRVQYYVKNPRTAQVLKLVEGTNEK